MNKFEETKEQMDKDKCLDKEPKKISEDNTQDIELIQEDNKEMYAEEKTEKKIEPKSIEKQTIEETSKEKVEAQEDVEQNTEEISEKENLEKDVELLEDTTESEKNEEFVNENNTTEFEEIDKEDEPTVIEEINKEEDATTSVEASKDELFTIILTPKGYKYSEDGENIAYDEDAYRYNGEYEEEEIKEKRIANLNKALEGKIEQNEIQFLQQYGDLSLAKIMSQYEKSTEIPKEYIETIKALAKENKISIKYDLTKSSVLSRFASILKREKTLDLDQIDELKAMAYNARGYAEIKASPMTKLSFKVKDMVRGSNQKMLGDGKEKKE